MSTISSKVLNKIKKEQIRPMPRWYFWLRDGSKWFSLGLLILVVGVAMSLLMFFWSDGPWLHGGGYGISLLFGRMPLILLVLILMGGLFATFDFYKTGRGYRYSLKKVGLALIVVALLVGWLFYYLGLSQRFDSAISRAPFYQNRQAYMMHVWQDPNKGLIAGEIFSVIDSNNFYLKDFSGKQWKVDATNAIWRHDLVAKNGLAIKLIGSARGADFKADEIRPWMGAGGCGMLIGQGACGMMR